VGLSRRFLPWLACAAVATAGVPAFADGGSDSQAPGSINAVDFAFENPATNDSTVTINAGETVTFAYPTGGSVHNVTFSGAAPTSCVQTAGTNVGAVPPLPSDPQGAGWSGQCTFNTAGTYAFVCNAHGFMTGEVRVLAGGGSTATPTPTPTTTTTPTPTPTSTPTPTEGVADQLKLARQQRGRAV
jgi:plastocyanin